MGKLKVGVIFGGVAEEHPISIKSAVQIEESLDTEKYDPVWIGVTKSGEWKLCEGPGSAWETDDSPTAILSPDTGTHGLLVLHEDRHEVIPLDLIFPVLHGEQGEDGAMQGLFELSGIPYIGCGIAASALCNDKSLAYTVVRESGVATPEFWVVHPGDDVDTSQFSYPVFVKPARSGSSFGISKVAQADEFPAALEEARRYDSKVLIEEAIVGSEIGCSVLGTGKDLFVGEADHVVVTSGFFRIHQESTPEKGSENSHFVVPADISAEATELVKETAKTIFSALGCYGIARVDMFVTPEGKVVLNEVNTLPGLTSYSRYPRMMAAAGVSLSELIDRLVRVTLDGPSR